MGMLWSRKFENSLAKVKIGLHFYDVINYTIVNTFGLNLKNVELLFCIILRFVDIVVA